MKPRISCSSCCNCDAVCVSCLTSGCCFGRFQLVDRENEHILKRVADAMKGGHYPSPADAKIVADQLQKSHLNTRRKKLEVYIFTVLFVHPHPCRCCCC